MFGCYCRGKGEIKVAAASLSNTVWKLEIVFSVNKNTLKFCRIFKIQNIYIFIIQAYTVYKKCPLFVSIIFLYIYKNRNIHKVDF